MLKFLKQTHFINIILTKKFKIIFHITFNFNMKFKKIKNIYFYIIIFVLLLLLLITLFSNNYKEGIINIKTLPPTVITLSDSEIKKLKIKFEVHPITILSNTDIQSMYNRFNLGNSGDPILDNEYKQAIIYANDVTSDSNAGGIIFNKPSIQPNDDVVEFKNKVDGLINDLNTNYPGQSFKRNNHLSGDAIRCYKYALLYLATKENKYADKVLSLFKSWIICQIQYPENWLYSSWPLLGFTKAEEIIKHTYDGWNDWSKENETNWHNWLKNFLVNPILKKWYDKDRLMKTEFVISIYHNGTTSCLAAMMMYAKITNDFDLFIKRVRNSSGVFDYLFRTGIDKNSFYDTGQTVEASRDIAHATMGIGFLACTCEILWHHGYNLYGRNKNILLKYLHKLN